VADEAGTLWIADTAANRILGYTRSGKQVSVIDLKGRAVGVTDLAPIGPRLALLDTAAWPPAVLIVDKANGRTVSALELPDTMWLEDGLKGISADSDRRLYAEVGAVSMPIEGTSSRRRGWQGAFGVAEVKLDKSNGNRSATVIYRGKSLSISGKHRLAGVTLIGDTADQSAYAVDEAVVDAGGRMQVDRTIHVFGPDGSPKGQARVPITSSLYVDHGVTMTRGNEIVTLLARDTQVDIVRLQPSATVADILPEEPDPASAELLAPGPQAAAACRSYDSMRGVAVGYRDNSKALTNANINGACAGRTKPRYLTTAMVYRSVSYDWDGFDTVANWNSYMSDGKQAGDITTSATNGCSKGVDCSGFVSRVWGLSSHVYTSNLDTISTKVSGGLHSMLPFDIFLKQGSHVIFFSGWYDDYETDFYVYESTTTNSWDRVVYHLVDAAYVSGYEMRTYENRC